MNTNGAILWEGLHAVVIVTGLRRPSKNRKTGPMIQCWILPRWRHPAERGADHHICGDCTHSSLADGDCYVEAGKAPSSIWRSYRAGNYPRAGTEVVAGKRVRLGAWGDPAVMPGRLVRELAEKSGAWTGYTHQWRRATAAGLRGVLMASVESQEQADAAQAAGWRTFRVAPAGNSALRADEIRCPAAAESGERTTCARCRLCAGRAKAARNVVIQKH